MDRKSKDILAIRESRLRQSIALLRAWCRAHPFMLYNERFLSERLEMPIELVTPAVQHLIAAGFLVRVSRDTPYVYKLAKIPRRSRRLTNA